MSKPDTAARLNLEPHPEGGWFRETWSSDVTFHPSGYPGPRAAASAIYYFLDAHEESRWHVVRSAELWLWHAGGPLRLTLGGDGTDPEPPGDALILGPDLAEGQRPQLLVPGGTWQSARPAGAAGVLVSCVVAPAFHYDDFEVR